MRRRKQKGGVMRILLVEDEEKLAANIRKGVQSVPSYRVDLCYDGAEGLEMALAESYDAVILDLMLPGMDGLTVLQRLRAAGSRVPVLILTAKSSTEDIIRGLDYGSDDYLAKPFDMGELIARLKALVRRFFQQPDPVITVGHITINTASHTVTVNGSPVTLPNLEYRLLEYLGFHADEVVSKTDLLEHLYDYNWEKFSNVIEVYISSLRTKLEKDGHKLIHTLRGQGYMLSERA